VLVQQFLELTNEWKFVTNNKPRLNAFLSLKWVNSPWIDEKGVFQRYIKKCGEILAELVVSNPN
jgi:hypothetical protein